jgi:DNA-binding NtrC family response regulator
MITHWRILVVGDSADSQFLAARLRADGHLVDTTPSRLEAINQARDRKYLAYILDFEMTGPEGIEMIGEIRKVQPEASVIVAARGAGMEADEFSQMASQVLCGYDSGPGLMSMESMEKRLINAILAHAHGNIRESANILGIDRSTLYEKIKKYGIPRIKERPRKGSGEHPPAPK